MTGTKRLIFVDDEPRILRGLKRTLYPFADRWDMVFVESGTAAVAEMDKSHFDVVVTDMRMPGMDGAALLKHVHAQYPEVVRIVLSAHTELEAAMRAAPVAHQFLIKPSSAQQLEKVIEQACSLPERLADDTIRRAVGRVDQLPIAPKRHAELTQALSAPEVSLKRVASIVGQEPAMIGNVLRLVNGAFFRMKQNVGDIGKAVSQIGAPML